MAHPAFLNAETMLYSPMEPEGRLFPAGSDWPGDAWSDKPGGEPVGGNAAAGALKDLIDANDRLDQQARVLASKDHDLAQASTAKEEALAKVADLEQRAIAAETAQGEAETAATDYMAERDAARAEVTDLTGKLETATEKVSGLVEQIDAANQTIADLRGQLAKATAPAPAKPTKTKAADAPEPAAADAAATPAPVA